MCLVKITKNGELEATVGLAMINVGPCMTCKQSKSLMYAVFYQDKKKKPVAPTCSDCMHIGGMFKGIQANYLRATNQTAVPK